MLCFLTAPELYNRRRLHMKEVHMFKTRGQVTRIQQVQLERKVMCFHPGWVDNTVRLCPFSWPWQVRVISSRIGTAEVTVRNLLPADTPLFSGSLWKSHVHMAGKFVGFVCFQRVPGAAAHPSLPATCCSAHLRRPLSDPVGPLSQTRTETCGEMLGGRSFPWQLVPDLHSWDGTLIAKEPRIHEPCSGVGQRLFPEGAPRLWPWKCQK